MLFYDCQYLLDMKEETLIHSQENPLLDRSGPDKSHTQRRWKVQYLVPLSSIEVFKSLINLREHCFILDLNSQFNHYVDIDVSSWSWLGVVNHSSRATWEETDRNPSLRFDCHNHYATKTYGFVVVYSTHSSKELVGQLHKSAALLAGPFPVVDVAEYEKLLPRRI